MADAVPLTVSKVFQDYIKVLGLREFPCGTGSWHETCDHLQTVKKERLKPETVCSLLNQDDASKEKRENLVDLITFSYSPWYLDYSWSKEAKGLREIAIKSPHLINAHFVYSYFRTLKTVDKGVTEVDNGLVRLKNLEELTLSANYITSVNSKCLPPLLKVLELCANNIENISDLCIKPPPLEHLGLGRNKLSVVGNYISGAYWPDLVSLDLSHNNICGLIEIVETLNSLPKLRNLHLQGNPISLIPGYRGYIIDCLQDLTVLDDKHITFDEKHSFRGVAEFKERILDEAIVQIEVKHIKGLPCPAEVMNPELQQVFPVLEKSYFVQFTIPVQFYETPQETEMQVVDYPSLSEVPSQTEKPENETDNVKVRTGSNQSFQAHEETHPDVDLDRTSVKSVNAVLKQTQSTRSTDVKIEEPKGTLCTKLGSISCQPHSWEEVIIFNWTTDLVLSDLLFLRDFFQTGMDVTIVEQTIESYPEESNVDSSKTDKIEDKEKDQKDKKKNKAQKKETITKPTRKEQVKEKMITKKKKQSFVELVRSPPKFTNVAIFHMPLDSLLNGEYEYKAIFTKRGDFPHTSGSNKVVDDMDKLKGRSKSKGYPDKKADVRKHLKAKDSDKKQHKLKADFEGAEEEAEELTYLPLELELCVKLHHWLTATDTFHEVEQPVMEAEGDASSTGGKLEDI